MPIKYGTGGSGGKKASSRTKRPAWLQNYLKQRDQIRSMGAGARGSARRQSAESARYRGLARYYSQRNQAQQRRQQEAASDPDMARAQHWMRQRRPVMESVRRRPSGPYGGQMSWDQFAQHEYLTSLRNNSTLGYMFSFPSLASQQQPEPTGGSGRLRESYYRPRGGYGRGGGGGSGGRTGGLGGQQQERVQNFQQKPYARWMQQVANWNIRGR